MDGKSLWLNYISDMEAQIHLLEQEAYTAVLRAFKAQSDAISWVLSLSSFFGLIDYKLLCVLSVSMTKFMDSICSTI